MYLAKLYADYKTKYYYFMDKYRDECEDECTKYWNAATNINNNGINPLLDICEMEGIKHIDIDSNKDIVVLFDTGESLTIKGE